MSAIKHNLPGISRGVVRDAINEQIHRFMESNAACSPYVPPAADAPKEFIDFASTDADVELIRSVVESALFEPGSDNDDLVINQLIALALENSAAGKSAVLPNGASWADLFRVTVNSGTYMEFDYGNGRADVSLLGLDLGNRRRPTSRNALGSAILKALL